MKFLIYDYTNQWNTESLYFNAGINLLNSQNISSYIFNNNVSIYDNIDNVNPNAIITNIKNVHKDLLQYIKNENPKIKLAINIDDMNVEQIAKFAELLTNTKIEFVLFGDKKLEKIHNYACIMPGADIFLCNQQQSKQYNIDKLIFILDREEIKDLSGTYHYTTINIDLADSVDFVLDIHNLQKILPNYSEILFENDKYIGSEIMFNALLSKCKVAFKNNEYLNDLFKGQKLHSAVKQKHTCLHRLKTLMNCLGYNDIAKNLDPVLEKI